MLVRTFKCSLFFGNGSNDPRSAYSSPKQQKSGVVTAKCLELTLSLCSVL